MVHFFDAMDLPNRGAFFSRASAEGGGVTAAVILGAVVPTGTASPLRSFASRRSRSARASSSTAMPLAAAAWPMAILTSSSTPPSRACCSLRLAASFSSYANLAASMCDDGGGLPASCRSACSLAPALTCLCPWPLPPLCACRVCFAGSDASACSLAVPALMRIFWTMAASSRLSSDSRAGTCSTLSSGSKPGSTIRAAPSADSSRPPQGAGEPPSGSEAQPVAPLAMFCSSSRMRASMARAASARSAAAFAAASSRNWTSSACIFAFSSIAAAEASAAAVHAAVFASAACLLAAASLASLASFASATLAAAAAALALASATFALASAAALALAALAIARFFEASALAAAALAAVAALAAAALAAFCRASRAILCMRAYLTICLASAACLGSRLHHCFLPFSSQHFLASSSHLRRFSSSFSSRAVAKARWSTSSSEGGPSSTTSWCWSALASAESGEGEGIAPWAVHQLGSPASLVHRFLEGEGEGEGEGHARAFSAIFFLIASTSSGARPSHQIGSPSVLVHRMSFCPSSSSFSFWPCSPCFLAARVALVGSGEGDAIAEPSHQIGLPA